MQRQSPLHTDFSILLLRQTAKFILNLVVTTANFSINLAV